jgi:hypothetical protein
MSTEDQSLLERVEAPSIPESAMKQIAILEEQFARAEVEQSMFYLPILVNLLAAPAITGEYHSNQVMNSC